MASTPSLGQAYGLMAKPTDYTAMNVELIQRQRAEEDAAIKAARAAHAKTLENIDKYKAETDKWLIKDAAGIIPPLQEPIKAKTAELYEYIRKKKGDNENYNILGDDELRMKKDELSDLVNRNKLASETFMKQAEAGVLHPDKFDLNQDMLKASKGTFADWTSVTDATQPESAKGTGHYISGVLIPKEQAPEMPKLLGAMSSWAGQQQKITTEEGAQFTPDKVKAESWETFKQASPEWKATVANWVAKGMTEEEAEAQFKPQWARLFDVKAAPTTAEDRNALTEADIKTNIPINIVEGETGKKVENIAPYGITLPSNVALNIPASKNIINRATGRALDYTGQINITGGDIISAKIGTKKEGFKFVPMLYASAPLKDAEGKTVQYDIEIPLSEIKGQKVLDKHKGAIDILEKKISALNEKPAEQKTAKKAYTKAELTAKAKAAGYTYDEYYKLVKDKIELK